MATGLARSRKRVLEAIALVMVSGVLVACEAGVNQPQRQAAAERRLSKVESQLADLEDRLNAGTTGSSDGGAGLQAIEERLGALEARLNSGGGETRAGDAAELPVADLRHGILIDCGGAERTPANPFGLAQDQWRSAAAARDFFRAGYERASRFYQRRGAVRIVWRRLAGSSDDDTSADMAALAAMDGRQMIDGAWSDRHPWRRRIFIDETAKFLADHPGATDGVAIGALVPLTWQSVDHAVSLPAEPFDAADPGHRTLALDQVVRPLAAIGVGEIWLEGGAATESLEGTLTLASLLKDRFGVHCVVRIAGEEPVELASLLSRTAVVIAHGPTLELHAPIPGGELIGLLDVADFEESAEAITPESLQSLFDFGIVCFSLDAASDAVLLEAIAQSP